MEIPKFGPTFTMTHTHPLKDSSDLNMVVEFVEWGDQWAWRIYWCDEFGSNMCDHYVINENGHIIQRVIPLFD